MKIITNVFLFYNTLSYTVNIRHEIIFVANRLNGNLPVNGS